MFGSYPGRWRIDSPKESNKTQSYNNYWHKSKNLRTRVSWIWIFFFESDMHLSTTVVFVMVTSNIWIITCKEYICTDFQSLVFKMVFDY